MARIVKPLSDKQIKEAKPKAKDYKLTDGDGLGLIVSKSGRKRWVFAFISPDTGKLNNTGLQLPGFIASRSEREANRA